MDYKKDIIINPHALHEEWMNQPALFMKYAELLTEKKKELEYCEEELDILEAEVDIDIRENSTDKMTEAKIKNLVITDPRVQKKKQKYIDLKYEVDLYAVCVKGFEQRKSALENLVKLFGMSYYSDPNISSLPDSDLDGLNSRAANHIALNNTKKTNG